MDKQRELAELLWAMDDTKKSYQKLIAATDELVKSQFMEQFGGPGSRSKYDTIDLGSISSMISGGTPSSKHPEFLEEAFRSFPRLALGRITLMRLPHKTG